MKCKCCAMFNIHNNEYNMHTRCNVKMKIKSDLGHRNTNGSCELDIETGSVQEIICKVKSQFYNFLSVADCEVIVNEWFGDGRRLSDFL